MVGYTTVGTNEFERAAAFYDELLATLGAKRLMEFEGFIVWGTSLDQGCLALTKPYDQKAATVGNGVMVAIRVDSRDVANAFYNKAIELGAQDEGPPGPRGEGFYAAYFRDLDGNKLNAFVLG